MVRTAASGPGSSSGQQAEYPGQQPDDQLEGGVQRQPEPDACGGRQHDRQSQQAHPRHGWQCAQPPRSAALGERGSTTYGCLHEAPADDADPLLAQHPAEDAVGVYRRDDALVDADGAQPVVQDRCPAIEIPRLGIATPA